MKPDQFTAEQQKHLVKTIEGAWAFVPPPLPPNIKIGEIATNLTSAASVIGELNGLAFGFAPTLPFGRALGATGGEQLKLFEAAEEVGSDEGVGHGHSLASSHRLHSERASPLPVGRGEGQGEGFS